MQNKLKKAFTLVEVIAVCIIIAILSSIAVSMVNGYKTYAVHSRLNTLAQQLNQAQGVYLAEHLLPISGSAGSNSKEAFITLKPYVPALSAYNSLTDFMGSIASDAHMKLESIPYVLTYTNDSGAWVFTVESAAQPGN